MHPLPRPRDPLPDPALPTPPVARSDRARTRPTAPVLVRDAVAADVDATARLHIDHLSVGLFPRMGHRFVACWHRAYVLSPHAVALVAVEPGPDGGGHVAGFLVGALDRLAFHQELLTRHRTRLAIRAVVALVLRPRVLIDFLRTRLRPYLRRLRAPRQGPSLPPGALPAAPVADLSAIAVDPVLRRTGTGRRLTEEFLDRSAAAGAVRVELVTAADSAASVAFYTSTGWTARRRYDTRDGRALQRFVRWTDNLSEG